MYMRELLEAIDGKEVIDMEPLELLMKYITDSNVRSIGGNPQMIKITKFLQTLPYGFYTENNEGTGNISFFGRNLLKYETFPYPIYDLKSGETFYMKGIVDKLKREHEETETLTAFDATR